jgi:predicted dehydrogenase
MASDVKAIRVGVIGTGVMGGHHARVAASLPGSRLVGIYDPDGARAADVAATHGVQPADSIEALCANADAVIVASPTITHGEVGRKCLEAGCHVLIEKPIAATLDEAEDLVELAARNGRYLMTGHVERFNPAVMTAMSMVDGNDIFDCAFQRLSPVSGRDRSVDIVLDLMIHDIDLALGFVGQPVRKVQAVGQTIRGELIDHVTALLRFEDGTTASLTASAVSQARVRTGVLFTRQAQYTVDFAARDVMVVRDGRSVISSEHAGYTIGSQVEQILVPAQEPLQNELRAFLDGIRSGQPAQPDGRAGTDALRIALAVQTAVWKDLKILRG